MFSIGYSNITFLAEKVKGKVQKGIKNGCLTVETALVDPLVAHWRLELQTP